jgi:hypothetical protein
VVVHRGQALDGDLGDAVVRVRRRERVIRDREVLAAGEADRVIGRGEDDPGHPGPARRLERHIAAVDVDLGDLGPGTLAGDPGQVDDGVRAGAGVGHRRQVGHRGLDGLFAGPGGQRGHVEQAQRPARPGQPGPQHGPDEARGPGDHDDGHPPASHPGPVTDVYQVTYTLFLSARP